MKLKKIVIFFPNFSRGGIEKTSLLLTNYFLDKKIQIDFISFASLKKLSLYKNRLFKNIKIYNVKNKFTKSLFSISILCSLVYLVIPFSSYWVESLVKQSWYTFITLISYVQLFELCLLDCYDITYVSAYVLGMFIPFLIYLIFQ